MNGPKYESDPKRIPQLAPVNRILPIKFRAYKGHSDDPIILMRWSSWCCLDNIQLKPSGYSSHNKLSGRKI
jgi:hypothetical protein